MSTSIPTESAIMAYHTGVEVGGTVGSGRVVGVGQGKKKHVYLHCNIVDRCILRALVRSQPAPSNAVELARV